MLGKAGTIQTVELTTGEINAWFKSWPDVEIIDIQYRMVFEQNYGCHAAALIIYKENESQPSELEEAYKRINELEERNKGLE